MNKSSKMELLRNADGFAHDSGMNRTIRVFLFKKQANVAKNKPSKPIFCLKSTKSSFNEDTNLTNSPGSNSHECTHYAGFPKSFKSQGNFCGTRKNTNGVQVDRHVKLLSGKVENGKAKISKSRTSTSRVNCSLQQSVASIYSRLTIKNCTKNSFRICTVEQPNMNLNKSLNRKSMNSSFAYIHAIANARSKELLRTQ
eukprot:TRINITY_DN8305_c0_g1_i4.p1 TRINITY_DN8305_c0_g1~~TRINITY_DN8305_c0_g1_i4.p1  ORF type:complete len:198 (+),score=6.98 TRINITY_DN8305_c0_g1_i4:61-654(+)